MPERWRKRREGRGRTRRSQGFDGNVPCVRRFQSVTNFNKPASATRRRRIRTAAATATLSHRTLSTLLCGIDATGGERRQKDAPDYKCPLYGGAQSEPCLARLPTNREYK